MIGRYVSREVLSEIRREQRISRRARIAARRRDGGRCLICWQKLSSTDASKWNWHHVYPRNPPATWPHMPGYDDARNVARTHPRCNRKAGNRVTEEGLAAFHDITGYWPHCIWPRP